jgi:subtilase family serine protease
VDIPAAVPEVTAVGGSEFTGDGSAGANTYWTAAIDNDSGGGSAITYIPEQAWNDTAQNSPGLDSAGGGFSTLYLKPTWQTGTGVPADGHRDLPDVTLSASNFHDPYLLCSGTNTPQGLLSCSNQFRDSSGGLDAVGGTSAGAPTFAGIIALLDQAVDPTGLGSVNHELYALAASTPSAFHDIKSGDNKQPCTAGTPSTIPMAQRCPTTAPLQIGYAAGVGYDLASGLGSVDAHKLVTSWPGFSVTPTYTVGANAVTIASAGGTGTSTLTVAAVNGFNGTVTLTCKPPASTSAKITCSITPSVTINGSSDTATLTVNTTAAHAVAGSPSAMSRSHRLGWLGASSGAALAGIFVIGLPSRRKWTAMFGLVLFAFMVTGVGCGGGSSSAPSNPGTPAGNYTVVVTAVSASITRTLNVSITVQ